jgi:hypothetical protein
VFGGEMDEDLRRLIDEGWREVIGGSKLQEEASNGRKEEKWVLMRGELQVGSDGRIFGQKLVRGKNIGRSFASIFGVRLLVFPSAAISNRRFLASDLRTVG